MPHEHGTLSHRVLRGYGRVHIMHGTYPVLRQTIYWALGIVEGLLGLRFLLSLFGANTAVPFVSFIYGITDGLLAPFRFVFPATVENGVLVEWSTLFAMAVYLLLAWAVLSLINTIRTALHRDMTDERNMRDEDDEIREMTEEGRHH